MRSILPVATICSLIASGLMFPIVPAEAGHFTIHITPRGRDAKVFRQGLELYSLFQGFKNHAQVSQRGSNNSAGIGQYGSGDVAAVFQDGSRNSGTVTQRGNNDALALFQLGKGNSSNTQQSLDGQTGIVLQGGW